MMASDLCYELVLPELHVQKILVPLVELAWAVGCTVLQVHSAKLATVMLDLELCRLHILISVSRDSGKPKWG